MFRFSQPYLREGTPPPVVVHTEAQPRFEFTSPPPISFGEFLQQLEEEANSSEGETASLQESAESEEASGGVDELSVEENPGLSGTVQRVRVDPVFVRQDGLFEPRVTQIVTVSEILPLFVPVKRPGTLGLPPDSQEAFKPVPFQPPHAEANPEPFSTPVEP